MNQDLLVRYLLDELPEAERAGVEEQLFFDETLFAKLMDLESSMQRSRSRDGLTLKERERMELNLLRTQEERLKTTFALALFGDDPVPKRKRSKRRDWRWLYIGIALAAACAALWLAADDWGLRTRAAAFQSRSMTMPMLGVRLAPAPRFD